MIRVGHEPVRPPANLHGYLAMPANLKFSQKILLAASLVTIVAFTLFVLFNDYRQRQALNADVHAALQEVGDLATRNIKTWLDGRIQLVESLAQRVEAGRHGLGRRNHRLAGGERSR